MTNTEKEIQKNLYTDMENTFWQMIESELIWYFQEYWNDPAFTPDPTFTPTVLASIFSDMIRNNVFKLAEEIENECSY